MRVILVIAALAVGAVAVYFAIQELGDQADVEEADDQQAHVGPARTVVVRITADGFRPRNVSVREGETVRWVNNDDAVHEVETRPGPGGGFDSGPLEPDERFERGFVDAGTVRYADPRNPDAPPARVTVFRR